MKITPTQCPECGARINGTLDWIPAVALLAETTPGSFAYTGESDIIWDGQHTQTLGGQPLIVCERGHKITAAIDPED